MWIFDCETDGLLDELTVIHCLTMYDTATGKTYRANDHGAILTIEEGLRLLQDAPGICGHNIIDFDIPAMQKVYPWFKPTGVIRDTMLMSQLIYTDIADKDFAFIKKGRKFDKALIGRHSLKAWGYRLGEWKGDYADDMKAKGLDPWAEWNQAMDDYCVQDVVVTTKLYKLLMSKGFSEESIQLEHDVAPIMRRQERYGFLFNREAALILEATLVSRRAELGDKLRVAFPPWEAKDGKPLIPKRDNKARGYVTYPEVIYDSAEDRDEFLMKSGERRLVLRLLRKQQREQEDQHVR